MKFRIGQRVRIANPEPGFERLRGAEATIKNIVPPTPWPYEVITDQSYPGVVWPSSKEWCCFEHELVPLTPDSEWAREAVTKVTTLPAEPIELEPETLAEVTGGA